MAPDSGRLRTKSIFFLREFPLGDRRCMGAAELKTLVDSEKQSEDESRCFRGLLISETDRSVVMLQGQTSSRQTLFSTFSERKMRLETGKHVCCNEPAS